MIAIIDYGLGNLSSIKNMCRRLNIDAEITSNIEQIQSASRLILPGVGHFKKGMENLQNSGLKEVLEVEVIEKCKPILGICLGAQLMTNFSEEGNVPGLGWVDAKTVRFDQGRINGLKVPHMGWGDIEIRDESKLWQGLPELSRFYFVHTYHFRFSNEEEVSAVCHYAYDFACAFRKGNIYGTQFHPEKSHKFGMKILENFNLLN